ncbi:MAG TPA: hypothetical protein VL091_05990, partial [Marinobacter sp.]|nr:hypothetical protein [Marinobacter sp.]
MYCNAAVSFKPTVANVSAAQELPDVEKARQACNAATVAAMGSGDDRLARDRDRQCESYRTISKE